MLTLGATALKMFATGNDAVSITTYYAAYNLAIHPGTQFKRNKFWPEKQLEIPF